MPSNELLDPWLSCPQCVEYDDEDKSEVAVHHDGEHLTIACTFCGTGVTVWNDDRTVFTPSND